MINNKAYLGRGWAFPPMFIKGVGADMVSNEEDIKQSLEILLSTIPGERIFRFNYGCNIHKWVFGEINLSTETLIRENIKQAILMFEPRIEVESIDLDTTDVVDGTLWINISYIVSQTNNRSNIVYPFYIKEGTNITSN